MKPFLDQDFLLETKTAQLLYHDHAKDMPIIDYHNHLPPEEIATNKQFKNITEVWLKGDHYKWRAMRANGIDEEFITGDADDKTKFLKWAETTPYTMRNPLYHWTHLELQRYFGINDLLNDQTADQIYMQTAEHLRGDNFTTQGLLEKMKVKIVCTTDDPTDDLASHKSYARCTCPVKMLPGFRPDKFILINRFDFFLNKDLLEDQTSLKIESFDDYMLALQMRIEYFHINGCRLSDHGLNHIYAADFNASEVDRIFKKRLSSREEVFENDAIIFQSAVLHNLAKMYHDKGWVMQFHLGALRNNSARLNSKIGADVGADSIGDFEQAVPLSKFLNRLDAEEKLCKTVIYNLNPRDNEVFATMAGNFNDGSSAGKIQWGSAWWFLDQKDGMEDQINILSNMGLLSRFIGMLTDSRSFLSFPRHEYFRRILCNLIGTDVEKGELPNDIPWLGQMVQDISYNNANSYFDFSDDQG